MTAKFHDFDAAFAEQAQEPLVVRIYGQDWEIPADPPAIAVLRQQRRAAAAMDILNSGAMENLQPGDDVPPEILEILGIDMDRQYRDLLGDDNVTAWLERGITDPQLRGIEQWVTEQRNGGGDEGNRATRRAKSAGSGTSSKAGRSSKRTSTASTGST